MLDAPPFAQKQMPGAMQQQAEPANEMDEMPEEAAGPEEQAAFDKLEPLVYAIMSDEKAYPQLEKMLATDPHKAIADATVTIIEKLEKEQGEQNPDVLQGLASEIIIPELAALAAEKGIQIPEPELAQIEAEAIGAWTTAHPDRVDAQGMQAIGGATMQAIEGSGNGQPG